MSLEYSIPIPGGRAEFWKKAELPPRKKRILETHFVPLEKKARELSTDPDASVSKEEAAAMLEMGEVGAFALMKSWTLTDAAGNQRPLPDSADAFLDLERPLYDALTEHAAKILAEEISPFSPEDAENNEQSPISA